MEPNKQNRITLWEFIKPRDRWDKLLLGTMGVCYVGAVVCLAGSLVTLGKLKDDLNELDRSISNFEYIADDYPYTER